LAITTICYAASPLVALALPVAAGFLVLACVAPAPAVVVGCSLAVLEGSQVPVAGLGALGATESAFLLIAVGWGWRAVTGAPGVRYPQIADYPIIAFILCLPLGLVVGAPATVVLRLGVMWVAFFFVFLTVKGFTPRELRNVLLALGLSAALLGVVGVLGYLSGGGAQVSEGGATVTGRAVGGIPDPNYYGAYLQMAAVPLLALVVAGATRWRVVAAAAVAIAGLGVVLSLSRGAIMGMVLGVGVVILAWSRTRAVSIALIAVLAATTAANLNPLLSSSTTEVVSERLTSIGVATENNKRTLIWHNTLDEIVAHPLGVGALQFSTVSERRGLTQRGVPLENVHNLYLNIAVELGVAGLLLYLLWLVRIGWDLTSEMRRRRPETYPIAVGVTGALLGYSFQALTVSQYRVETILAVFFVLAGVAAAARAWSDEPSAQDSAQDSAPVVATGSMARS
jgi:O-antigen ligase